MHRSRRRLIRLTLAVLLACLLPSPAPAATPEQVEQMLTKATAYLYKQQKDGHWEDQPRDPAAKPHDHHGGQWGGRTALATYALLAAGESPQKPELAQAIAWLQKEQITGVYALGMRCQVWYLLPQTPEVRRFMQHDARALMVMIHDSPKAGKDGKSNLLTGGLGHWGYVPNTGSYSHSRSQYAVLGIWAAAQTGAVEVPQRFWQVVEAAWVNNQDKSSGGWSYQHREVDKHPLTPGMTAVGVASLQLIQDYLYANRGVDCRDKPTASDAAIAKGLEWMTANFGKVATDDEYDRDFPMATLYAVERIGMASGRKYFGNVDWYHKAADWLLTRQKASGAFTSDGPAVEEMPSTCFGILFLARGRAPVMMNKLQYASEGQKEPGWNNRPRDVANLARWMGRTVETEVAWQVVNLDGASPADLHDAPILYIAGNDAVKLSDAHKAKLREYVHQGGLIVANPDCAGGAFASSIKQLGKELFGDYEFRMLPDDHLIYTNRFQRAKWRSKPQVQGLSNGVRELMLLVSSGDPAKDWQSMAVGGREGSWELGANLYLYASDNSGDRIRGRSHVLTADPKVTPTTKLTIARIEHPGNWDPEPGAWSRLGAYLHNRYKVGVEAKAIAPGQSLDGVKLAHLTGTDALQLTPEARTQFKAFVDAGGTLLVDAAGGSSAFADSVERVLAELFPGQPLDALPPEHPVFRAGSEKLPEQLYRPFARRVVGNAKTPRLKAITINNRPAVIYSREDLTAALVGQSIDGVTGYTPDAATSLVTQVVLHAHNLKLTAAQAPATPAPSTRKAPKKD